MFCLGKPTSSVTSVNQDEVQLDVIHGLNKRSVLIVQDWAMKFIPRKYRESQSVWFGEQERAGDDDICTWFPNVLSR